jgi:rare lipoprotein A
MTADAEQNACSLPRVASGAKVALGAAIAACTLVSGAVTAKAHDRLAPKPTLAGIASWYGPGFHGRQTANGERYDMFGLTAAHRSLPFGTKVRVTNRQNGKSVVVRINDRGPYVGQRVIDLSRGAAQAVSMTETGIAPVKLDVLPTT